MKKSGAERVAPGDGVEVRGDRRTVRKKSGAERVASGDGAEVRGDRRPATKKPGAEIVARVALAIGGVQFLIGGVWAFFWPENFYDTIASFPPFNLHLFHDVGAFQLGLAAAVFGCLFWTDVLLAGLFGGAVGTVTHAISHLIDRDLGGSASDPYTTGAIAVVLLAGFIARAVSYRRVRREG